MPTMASAEESCHVKYKGRKASYFCVRLPGSMYVCMQNHAIVKVAFGMPCSTGGMFLIQPATATMENLIC